MNIMWSNSLLVCFLTLSFWGHGYARTAGTEFVTAFMQNYIAYYGTPIFRLQITALQSSCRVTVSVPNIGFMQEVQLGAGQGITLSLPPAVELYGSQRSSNAIFILSTEDVCISSLNSKPYTTDTSVVYPATMWGNEYIVLTPSVSPPTTQKEFMIINEKLPNTVNIFLQANVWFEGSLYPAGSQLVIDLNSFESVQLQSEGDMSGTRVVSQLPVAVYSGHTCTWFFSKCNHVYEQLLPVASWGTHFMVPPLSFQTQYDTVTVQASQPTNVTIRTTTSTIKDIIDVGQKVEYELRFPEALSIKADKGIQVLLLFNGVQITWSQMYDPFMLNVLSVDQFCTSYTLDGQDGFDNRALLVVPTKDRYGVLFDGAPLANTVQWRVVGDTEYSWAEVVYQAGAGIHTVHLFVPFGLYSVGLAPMNGYGAAALCTTPAPVIRDDPCITDQGRANPMCIPPQNNPGICWAMGDPHYQTFDGRNFDFMGNSTYVIAKTCISNGSVPDFEVQAQNDNRGERHVSWVSRVILKVGGIAITVERLQRGRVTIDHTVWNLPVQINEVGVNVSQSGFSVIIQTFFGLVVQYDWESVLQVTLPAIFMNKVCGLCGNFNSDPADDFTTPSNTQATSAVEFGCSWKVSNMTAGEVCVDDGAGEHHNCGKEALKQWEGEQDCGIMNRTDGPFSGCQAVVNPSIYVKNCLFDTCMTGGLRYYLCKILEVYAQACQQGGVLPTDWRKVAKCPYNCPPNSHYEQCGSSCPPTCLNPSVLNNCTTPCVETCTCNPGFVLSGSECVPSESCGCLQNGRHIPVGEYFWADDICRVQCRCPSHGGELECKDVGCKAGQQCQIVNGIKDCYPVSHSTCMAAGDPHYYTFDGRTFDFQGTCLYQLVGLCSNNPGLDPFEVLVQNDFRGSRRVSITKLVQVNVYNLTITISNEYKGLVMVNGVLSNLPLYLRNGGVSIFKSGWSAVVQTSFGLTVSFDWNSIASVDLPSTYAGAVCGLCGNYNGKPEDDLTPKGTNSSSAGPDAFGASWSVAEVPGCVLGYNGSLPNCDVTQMNTYKSAEFCGVLRDPNGPFRECFALLDPVIFFENCVYDVCTYNGQREILCQAIEAYMSACQAMGAKIYAWRTDQFCGVQCPVHSHYEVCGPGCPVTCNSLSSPPNCQRPCAEGCVCDTDFILSGDNCVPFGQCGCVYGTEYYSQGQLFYPENCEKECRCMEDGQVVCKKFFCGPFEKCEVVDGVRQCQPVSHAVCEASGDPHYTSFDGLHFDFQGTCTYVLSQTCGLEGSELLPFYVKVENERWSNSQVSVTKQVSLTVYGYTFVLRQNVAHILVNGVLTDLPWSLNVTKVQLSMEGANYVITTDFGLQVTYDLSYYVTVKVPSTYHNKTCGLCGNFDGNPSNDFRLPEGNITNSVNAFGNAWKVNVPGVQCEDGCEGRQCPDPQCPPQLRAIFGQTIYCGLLADPTGPFAACHRVLPPSSYLDDCIFDVCVAKGSLTVACGSLAAYSFKCHMNGVEIKSWRTESFCPMSCPLNSHYEPCADLCSVACPGLTNIVPCSQSCAEGCSCDVGYMFNGQQCVPYDQCGCYEAGRTYKPGEVVFHAECEQRCVCDPVRGLTCQTHTCSNGTRCLLRDGVMGCFHPDPCEDARCRQMEICSVVHGQAVCVPRYIATCWAWGDPHYQTFDGLAYDFQGTFKYVLSKTCGGQLDGLVPFTVTESNDNRGRAGVSFVQEVEVEVYGVTVTMQKFQWGRVMVGAQTLHLPLVLSGGQVKVTQLGSSAVLQTDFGLQVSYDWNSVVSLQLPSSYYASVCGLCGNFNGSRDDDLRGPGGTVATTVNEWAQNWRVNGSGGEAGSSNGCDGNCTVCPPDLQRLYATEAYCGALSMKSVFKVCEAKVDPAPVQQGCVYDLCVSEGDHRLLCQALEAYSSRCQQEGIIITNWRENFNCPMRCQPNSHYEACASPCPVTCSTPSPQPNCTSPCVEACVCDQGFVLSGTTCIPAGQCGCTYEGVYYPQGQRFWADERCHRLCECDGTLGVVVCRKASCPTGETCAVVNGRRVCVAPSNATCEAYGDPHYRTFDGRRYDFQGACAYQLVALCSERPDLTPFRVTVQNEHRGNVAVSLTRAVTVSVFGATFSLSREHPYQILLDGLLIAFPFGIQDQLRAYLSGTTAVLETTFGLRVTFDWTSVVRVTLPSTYRGAVCGLCGNYNGTAEDDFAMPNGMPAPGVVAFGQSWQVGSTPNCTSPAPCQGSQCPNCTDAQRQNAQSYCNIISDPAGPFGGCHAAVDPKIYMEDCVFDTCLFEGRQSVMCDALAGYASVCQSKGLTIRPWRNATFCPLSCPPNSHYNICAPGCADSCAGLYSSIGCGRPCGEGCQCDTGFVLSGQTCVPISECGCFYGGRYYEKHQVFYLNRQCQARCQCGENGAVTCQPSGCGPGEYCGVLDGELGCHPAGYSSCVASGDPHYKSFDGRRFDFQGACVYTLARVCGHSREGLLYFSVETENQKFGNGQVSVVTVVTVTVYNITISIGHGWTMMVNNEKMNFPAVLASERISVSQTGLGIVLLTDFGLQVLYSMYYVEVRVPSIYNSSMCGLCGNFNGDPADDLLLVGTNLSTSMDAFGQAWALAPPGVPCGGCMGRCPVCEPARASMYQRDDLCGLISSPTGPFGACHGRVDPKPYLDNCVFDLCVLDGNLAMLCQDVQAYAMACQQAGLQIQPWRNSTFCSVPCPAHSHYSLCSDNCGNTCASLVQVGDTCPVTCQEGCACDEGYVWSGDECVPLKDCGCVLDGRYLKVGEVSVSESCDVRCSCLSGGVLQCERQNCSSGEVCDVRDGQRGCHPTPGLCVLRPDALLRSFDGSQGMLGQSGAFQMAFLCDEESPDWFRVVVDVCSKATAGSVLTVYVFLQDTTITVNNQKNCWVNGKKVPYPSIAAGGVRVGYTGESVVIDRAPLIRVEYSNTQQVAVTISSALRGRVCGACGNFTEQMRNSSTPSSVVASWQAEDFSRCGL